MHEWRLRMEVSVLGGGGGGGAAHYHFFIDHMQKIPPQVIETPRETKGRRKEERQLMLS